MDFTNTPLIQPIPDDPVERVHRFARDLAWGALNGQWASQFTVMTTLGGSSWMSFGNGKSYSMHEYLNGIWDGRYPDPQLLVVNGFLRIIDNDGSQIQYQITQKAIDLKIPVSINSNVFISYKRGTSSALALLIYRMLKSSGIKGVFIDKDILAGMNWENHLKQVILSAKYFILVIGQDTLLSPEVEKEINYARQSSTISLIPVLHPQMSVLDLPEYLRSIHVVTIKGETAADYDAALEEVGRSMKLDH